MIDSLKLVEGLLKQGWTRYTSARDICHKPVAPASETAVSWCLLGAIERVVQGSGDSIKEELWKDVPGSLGYGYPLLVAFNDAQRNRRPVIALVKRTIKRLEKQLAA